MFARVLGPFVGILGIAVVARASEMRALVSDFESNSASVWVTGALVLLIGLVVIALHPYWRGAAAIMVSLLGWMIALRGLVLLAFPAFFVKAADATIGLAPLWIGVSIGLAVVGLYLTYVGWRPTPRHPKASAETSTTDELPHAA
ncbi:hypothetical protein [Mycobacterium sp. 852002-51163_SCH5372311]|uniref:hypothetical protein n=1 Tax=Mycobacterium sp. 852002-51163_SCH5372311 TaxID=1834097 RepID=UPI0012E734A0|nr:hypothetical protein [Mycobacterium sp. 852002-51163_SCH5372311]